jgi:hypothetical protein
MSTEFQSIFAKIRKYVNETVDPFEIGAICTAETAVRAEFRQLSTVLDGDILNDIIVKTFMENTHRLLRNKAPHILSQCFALKESDPEAWAKAISELPAIEEFLFTRINLMLEDPKKFPQAAEPVDPFDMSSLAGVRFVRLTTEQHTEFTQKLNKAQAHEPGALAELFAFLDTHSDPVDLKGSGSGSGSSKSPLHDKDPETCDHECGSCSHKVEIEKMLSELEFSPISKFVYDMLSTASRN